MNGADILLTGASGFVGGAIARALLDRGTPFAVLVRGALPPVLEEAVRQQRVTLIQDDLRGNVGRYWHTVIHSAAWLARGGGEHGDPWAPSLETNVRDSMTFLERTLAPEGHLVLLSTIDVYGRPETSPITENHPLRPSSFYAASKAAQEMFAAVLCTRSRSILTVLRLAQVYGPGDPSEKVIPTIARLIATGEAPVLHAGGQARRSWIYVDDTAAGVLAALHRRVPGTFNIVGPESCSVAHMAECLCRLANRGIRPVTVPEGECWDFIFDDRAARRQLGFQAKCSLEEGLSRYWEWLQRH
jgi:nucleoside-diphosphate-sugar epimerase